jgi:acyl-coenzyme A synthetase/AMP-(fatty) acid ligase
MMIETGQVTLQSHLELVEKYRPSTLRGSPNQIVQLLGHSDAMYHRINSIRTVSVIGSPLDNRMAKTILTAIPEVQINVGYGSTEAGISHRRLLTQLSQNKVDFLGKQVAAEVEIWGEKGERLGSNQSGLIAIRSDNMVREYFNNTEATQQHFKNGFFISGDRGRIDEGGMLWMDGRESELINFGGTKIDPQRIDNEAVTHEELKDACAFLFIGLAVVPVEKTADIKALATKLNEALGPVLSPRRYFVVSSIPRNAMGKPMRNVLTEKLSEKPQTS